MRNDTVQQKGFGSILFLRPVFNICVQRQKGRMFISNLLFKIGGGGGGGGKVQIHVVHFVDKRISISTYVLMFLLMTSFLFDQIF